MTCFIQKSTSLASFPITPLSLSGFMIIILKRSKSRKESPVTRLLYPHFRALERRYRSLRNNLNIQFVDWETINQRAVNNLNILFVDWETINHRAVNGQFRSYFNEQWDLCKVQHVQWRRCHVSGWGRVGSSARAEKQGILQQSGTFLHRASSVANKVVICCSRKRN